MLKNIYKSISDYFTEYYQTVKEIENPYIGLSRVLKERITLLEEALELRDQIVLMQERKIEFLESQLEQKDVVKQQPPFEMPKKNKGNLIYLNKDTEEFPYV